jgi:hypothetical protein|tara:strand:- start:188 stop:538 length:351 start_codon:yes stop_codon:yes gene_type:complete
MLKTQSKRAIFKQLLLNDVKSIMDDLNAGTWIDLVTLRDELEGSISEKYYYTMYNQDYTYRTYSDRWYRAIKSIQGDDIIVKKVGGKLLAFANTDFWLNSLKQIGATDWTADYNRN